MTAQLDIERARKAEHVSQLQFPSDLGEMGMTFTFYNYKYNQTQRDGFEIENPLEGITSSFALPLPSTIVDNYGLKIGEAQLGGMGGLAADAMSNPDGGLGQIKSAFNNMSASGEKMGKNLAEGDWASIASSLKSTASTGAMAAKYFGRNITDSIAPGVGLAIETTSGTAVNPHQTINFDGVNMKEYTFQWTLAPKSEQESELIKVIRDNVRYSILPDYKGITGDGTGKSSLDRAFLTYPDLCQAKFFGLNEDHYLRFKIGMIKSFNVNFTPQGNAILKGGKPAHVSVSMTYIESRPHSRKDFDDPTDSGSSWSPGA
jgi:hypothetical protein